MNTTNLTQLTALPEISDLTGLADGCNRAVVTYGLQEQTGHPNQFKLVKMVVLYCDTDLDTETAVVISNQNMMRNSVSLAKPFIYKIDKIVTKLKRDIYATLFKNIFGFTPKANIHDCRHIYNNYQGGNYNGTI